MLVEVVVAQTLQQLPEVQEAVEIQVLPQQEPELQEQ
jgi:hypothetical protein